MHYLIGKEGLDHWTWIGQSGRLNQQVIEFVWPSQQISNDSNEVTANGATNAPIIHFQNLLVHLSDQLAINPYLSELVDDYSDPNSVLVAKNSIEQRGFPGA
jgi:hypothetical protein